MSDCELDEKISELQVSSDPPKRGRGRPKKEKPPKAKREPLTEEQKAENNKRANLSYMYRRTKFGLHLVTMLKNGRLQTPDKIAEAELLEWAEKYDIKIPGQ